VTARVPVTVITGPLGSGKTTLLRHVLETAGEKLAILMNEFGEIAIDSQIMQGRNIRIAELGGGCVCCSLQGEFEGAVAEILDTVRPDRIIVETTGVAEPDALIFNIQENIPQVRIDGVVTLADADGLLRFPQVGQTGRAQIETADIILLNKIDLVAPDTLPQLKQKLEDLNPAAAILLTERGRVDPGILFGLSRKQTFERQPVHVHQPDVESFSYSSGAQLDRSRFEAFADDLDPGIVRAKGFVRLADGDYLFNYVSGRWELEPFPHRATNLVFIGDRATAMKDKIVDALRDCEV
jgi:G3E family GTPase